MTDNSVFKDLKEIIESYQDRPNNSGNFPEVNKNTFRCDNVKDRYLQRQISSKTDIFKDKYLIVSIVHTAPASV